MTMTLSELHDFIQDLTAELDSKGIDPDEVDVVMAYQPNYPLGTKATKAGFVTRTQEQVERSREDRYGSASMYQVVIGTQQSNFYLDNDSLVAIDWADDEDCDEDEL